VFGDPDFDAEHCIQTAEANQMLLSGPVSASGNYDLSGRRISSARAQSRPASSGDERSEISDAGRGDDDSISQTSEGSANSLSSIRKRGRRHVTIDSSSKEEYRPRTQEPKTRYPPLTPLTSGDSSQKLKCKCGAKLGRDVCLTIFPVSAI
jgi:hypothetical protein